MLNLARQQSRVFDEVLVTFGLERLLYRLSISGYREQFVLKGGMLVTQWIDDQNRVTRDVDFLAFGQSTEDHLKAVFTEILSIESEDGLVFDTDMEASPIRENQEYGGVRLKTTAFIEKTRIPITIDVGVGDAIADPHYTVDFPSLLGMPEANLRAYPPATVVAEKFHAIVTLGLANGRMKDYYDLWAIFNTMEIETDELDAAIRATFERRRTPVPPETPIGLSDEFAADEQKSQQWTVYAQSIELSGVSLETTTRLIWSQVGPACERLTSQ